ncbi:hypothetical protein QYE76_058173 [Lolium multiflorum]|uniref:Myb/SANT-like domain-containing protein n=1 Tax=Lolium multiflorum TaxID=4521 RepID=A0AAD8WPG2_LOLMU|nr:hypothetical protein QYE76_058173 [Lolium multiflorum]
MQKRSFGAHAETNMEMAGAVARIGEKQKGGGKDSVTSRRAHGLFLPPPPLSPQISSSSSRRQAAPLRLQGGGHPLPAINGHVADLVAQVAAELAARLAITEKNKNHREADMALKASQKGTGTMKWLPFMSSYILEKMCSLIKTGLRTNKGFKEVHLTTVAKGLFEHCGFSACSTQVVYNHLREWSQRWLTITRLRDQSGAQWCEDTKCIILEGEHYCGHVADHPKGAEFLNVPIANFDEMHTIFSFDLATGKYAMGSSEPLGSAATNPSPEDAETQESDTINLDGPPDKAADAPEKATAGKRNRGTDTSQTNPTKEIFSELHEINARGLIFPRSFRKTERITKWGDGAATPGPRGLRGARAALVCGALMPPLNIPFRLLKAFVAKTPVPRATIRKTFRARRANPISGDSGDHLRHPEESSPGGLFIAMITSGSMCE